jgi:hypothetical protein
VQQTVRTQMVPLHSPPILQMLEPLNRPSATGKSWESLRPVNRLKMCLNVVDE